MNYPGCPDKRTDCRFVNHGGMATLEYSPIEYDRDGKPIGGGNNVHQTMVECVTCKLRWHSTDSELEIAQGQPRDWKPRRDAISDTGPAIRINL